MTYREIIKKISEIEEFDHLHTIKHLTVSEVFKNDYILYNDNFLSWNDKADNETINELIRIENNLKAI